MTQQAPPTAQDGPPGVAPKFQPVKLEMLSNWLLVSPVAPDVPELVPTPPVWPEVVVSQ